MLGIDQVRTVLRTSWHLRAERCVPLAGRPDPSGWLVRVDGGTRVAKVVPVGERRRLEARLAAAVRLATAGLATGVPVRAADGAFCVPVAGSVIALLEYVPGRCPVRDDPLDQHWWGDLLGAAHRALAGFDHAGIGRFHGVRPDAPHLDVRPWVRPAVSAAAAAMAKLSVTDQLSYGVLHGDPAPGAFRFDADTGRTGLVAWGAAGTGPLVHDVASAVAHAGGPGPAADLIDGYLAAAPVRRDEVEAALPTALRFHYAVRTDRLARQLHSGVGDPVGAERDLRKMRRRLEPA